LFANKNTLNIGNVKNVTEAENRQKMNTAPLIPLLGFSRVTNSLLTYLLTY